MRKVLTWMFFIASFVLGVFMFVYGEIDDSPGGQLLGVMLVIVGVVVLVRNRRK